MGIGCSRRGAEACGRPPYAFHTGSQEGGGNKEDGIDFFRHTPGGGHGFPDRAPGIKHCACLGRAGMSSRAAHISIRIMDGTDFTLPPGRPLPIILLLWRVPCQLAYPSKPIGGDMFSITPCPTGSMAAKKMAGCAGHRDRLRSPPCRPAACCAVIHSGIERARSPTNGDSSKTGLLRRKAPRNGSEGFWNRLTPQTIVPNRG
jgi:hypothetical protein